MPDRKKVQHGLECCYNNNCGACPYSAIKKCQHKLYSDALALLKEQEPRVLTLDEVYNLHRGDFVYEEIKDGFEGNALMLYACENYYVDLRSADHKRISNDTSLYQKQWRCWTSRPTEEQRKNTPWEPPKGEDNG